MTLAIAGALAAGCIAAEESRPPAGRGDAITLTTKVEAIDYASRILAVQGPLGRTVALKVDDRVNGFGKIKAGDQVAIRYTPALALTLAPRNADGGAAVPAIANAAPRTALHSAIAQAPPTRIVARIEAIDGAHVLLAGSKERYVEVNVTDPALLRTLHVGDTVNAVYTDALVVEAAKKK